MMLSPGDTIGILGGGQLGRMLALAAARLGLRTHILAPDTDSPAFEVATHRTVADETRDFPAIDLIMGHEDSTSMATRYRERIGDERLQAVAEHVRTWLYDEQRVGG